jgi:hypothetical protein
MENRGDVEFPSIDIGVPALGCPGNWTVSLYESISGEVQWFLHVENHTIDVLVPVDQIRPSSASSKL